MEDIFQSAATLLWALIVLFFFGPIIVFVSIVGKIQLKSLIIDLSNYSKLSRVILAVLGVSIWLTVYIPLVLLAFKSLPSSVAPTSVVTPSSTNPSNIQVTEKATEKISIETLVPSETPENKPSAAVTETPYLVEMIKISSGSYIMGSSYFTGQERDFAPAHTVYIDEFFIDMYEVTNSQYHQCVDAGACNQPQFNSSNTREHYFDDLENYGNYPVIYISWNDARQYCNWRGARLPTEAEWEKAAKWNPTNRTANLYPWGGDGPTFDVVNFSSEDTSEVGKYSNGKSWFGALNMAGNVLEWVYDFYGEEYYSTSPELNPSGPKSSMYGHVVRGGAWSSIEEQHLWTIFRDYFKATDARNDLGFRCASDKAP